LLNFLPVTRSGTPRTIGPSHHRDLAGGRKTRNRAGSGDARRRILPSPPFGIPRLSSSSEVFHPLQKPIECPLPFTGIHGYLSVLPSKVTEEMQGVSVFLRTCTRRKKSRNLCWLQLFPFSRMIPGFQANRATYTPKTRPDSTSTP